MADQFFAPPQIGKFTKRMAVTAVSTTDTPDGGTTETPAVITYLWCSIEPLSGQQLWVGKAQQDKVSHLIKAVWQPGIRPQMKGIYNGRTFNFTSVVNKGERHVELEIHATEVVEPAP